MIENIDLTGRSLGGFKILRKLGRGGMAEVYKAHEESLNRIVALKVPSQRILEDETFIKRFQREAQAAAQLSHPNIVQIHAFGEEEGIHYFAMEYIKGETLKDVIARKGSLPPSRAVPIVRQVAEALAAAHSVGIVHRDIKPANIMLDSAGRVKVADFGIAQWSSAGTKLTREGAFMGTPEYISPDQCEGREVDGRSDIYSLGVTFYEMLTGKTPFEADTPAAMVLKIIGGKYPSIGEVKPDVPERVRQIVAKMMDKDKENRYQKADSLVKDLKRFEAGGCVPGTEMLDAQETIAETVREEVAKAIKDKDQQAAQRAPTVKDQSEKAPPQAFPVEQTPYAEEKKNTGKWAALVAIVVVCLLAVTVGGSYLLSDYVSKKGKKGDARADSSTVIIEDSEETIPEPPVQDDTDDRAIRHDDLEPIPDNEGTKQNTTPERDHRGSDDSDQADAKGLYERDDGTSGKIDIAERTDRDPQDRGDQKHARSWDPVRRDDEVRQRDTKRDLPPVRTEPPPPTPSPKTVVISTSGDYEDVDSVNAYVGQVFLGKGFKVIDGAYAPRGAEARFKVAATVKVQSSTALQYYGRSTQQYTALLTMKVISLEDGSIAAGPLIRTIKYTNVNAEQTIKTAADGLAHQLSEQIKSKIQ
ncbi:serine/threonine-protein kinase [Acidobacteriota bacterium]